jgi:hypothetical protein
MQTCDHQKKIAFSRYSTKQVLLNAHTLEQTIDNKIQAFLDRGEIRDCFDIEFIIRRGVNLPEISAQTVTRLRKKVSRFKEVDFKVKLGSTLEEGIRGYYIENRFSFLEEILSTLSSKWR